MKGWVPIQGRTLTSALADISEIMYDNIESGVFWFVARDDHLHV